MASRIYRNKDIGKHIREELTCCITGQPNPVNHHLIGYGYSGTGTKAADYLQMSLCDSLHRELHDDGWKSFEKKYGRSQFSMVAETLVKLHVDCVIDIQDFILPEWLYSELSKFTQKLTGQTYEN
jgi:Protein of unknown function (DUF968)